MGELAVIGQTSAQLPDVVGFDLLAVVLSGRKATTLKSYRGAYDDFGRFMGLDAGQALDALVAASHGTANGIALAYQSAMFDRGLSSATIAHRLAALRSAVEIARRLGRISWQLSVEAPKVEAYRDTRGPGDADWNDLRIYATEEARGRTAKSARDLAIIRLLHDLALRRGEVVALNIADIDLDESSVLVLGKGRSEKARLTLPAPVRRDLAAWLKFRDGAGPGDPVFVRLDRASGSTPGRMTGDSVAEVVRQLGERAGLKRPVKPHGLRHAAITSVLDRNNGDVRAAAKFSRHRDLRTLAVYDDSRRDIAGQMAELVSDE